MSIGIYKITSPTNKIYIGQSTNIEKRWDRNYRKLKCKRQIKIYNSLLKHGPENHIFEIIEECSLEQLNEREIYWGLHYDVLGENGLNFKIGKGRGTLSDEHKLKISNSLKKKKKTKEHCLNLSLAKKNIPSKRKNKPDLKQKDKPKPGAGGKDKPKPGAGPKTGNTVLDTHTGIIYFSIKKCMVDLNISKRKIFLMLKSKERFVYLNRNYYKR